MTPGHRSVHLRYHRPPDRTDAFVQELVLDRPDVKVTFARSMAFDPPMRVEGSVVLETGSDVVWFTFPGAWHDIGRFHRADGSFTGLYANVLTPVEFEEGDRWSTTDLFLDLWWGVGGKPLLLDAEELDAAERHGWVGRELAARAREEAERILEAARRGSWPPSIVEAWTRERILP